MLNISDVAFSSPAWFYLQWCLLALNSCCYPPLPFLLLVDFLIGIFSLFSPQNDFVALLQRAHRSLSKNPFLPACELLFLPPDNSGLLYMYDTYVHNIMVQLVKAVKQEREIQTMSSIPHKFSWIVLANSLVTLAHL